MGDEAGEGFSWRLPSFEGERMCPNVTISGVCKVFSGGVRTVRARCRGRLPC